MTDDEVNKGENIPQAEIDTLIAYFMSKIPAEMRDQLDYSPKSLDVVEGWLQERFTEEDWELFYDEYDGWDEGVEIKPGWIFDSHLIKGTVFYIGEVYRKHIGGYWQLPKLKPDQKWPYSYHEIIGSSLAKVICPFNWVGDMLYRRYSSPVELSQNLNATLSYIKSKSEEKH